METKHKTKEETTFKVQANANKLTVKKMYNEVTEDKEKTDSRNKETTVGESLDKESKADRMPEIENDISENGPEEITLEKMTCKNKDPAESKGAKHCQRKGEQTDSTEKIIR